MRVKGLELSSEGAFSLILMRELVLESDPTLLLPASRRPTTARPTIFGECNQRLVAGEVPEMVECGRRGKEAKQGLCAAHCIGSYNSRHSEDMLQRDRRQNKEGQSLCDIPCYFPGKSQQIGDGHYF